MTGYREARNFPLRLWVALVATVIAFAVSLVASLNLYFLEDTSQFTRAAYSASPLLRFSYDVIYLSALAAGVTICAIVGFALVRRERLVVIGLMVLALLIALGGFGGLMFRHFPTFLALFGIFVVLTLASFLIGRAVATRFVSRIGPRPAAIFGACVSAGSLLLVNVVALVIHTIILNPASHELYMQGQIQGTHFNFALIAMVVAFLTLIVCIASLGSALRLPARRA